MLFAEIHKALGTPVQMATLLPNESNPDGYGGGQRDGYQFGHHRQHTFEQKEAVSPPAQEFEYSHQLAGVHNDFRLDLQVLKALHQNSVLHRVLMEKQYILLMQLPHVQLFQPGKRMVFADTEYQLIM